MALIKGPFVNIRLKTEMNLFLRIIWITFGKRSVGESDGYYVVGYTLFNKTYINAFEKMD